MQKIGFIGIGKVGLAVCRNLIAAGYEVHGYRRSSLADFEALGGIAEKSIQFAQLFCTAVGTNPQGIFQPTDDILIAEAAALG